MKTIKDLTEIELKALAYDALAMIERGQNNLKAINAELELREKTKNEKTKEDVSGNPEGTPENSK